MLDWLRFGLGTLLMLGGLFVLVTAVLGQFRFRSALNRIHAAALVDTLGILLMLGGLILLAGWSVVSLKLVLVIAFLWLTSPVSSHLLGKLAVTLTDHPEREMQVDDPSLTRDVKEGD
ncbi:MAG: monovalent cation/H(+) antiporter subunit G [Clostridia bacterium]|nr:monovalent cation/H(+) antiporter subunit G [Clostridia bacterium]